MTKSTIAPIGVHVSGEQPVPQISYAELAQLAVKESEGPPKDLAASRQLIERILKEGPEKMLGPVDDLTPEMKLKPEDPEVGWGIVFHKDVPQEVREKLEPLRNHETRKGRLLKDWGPPRFCRLLARETRRLHH